jgi:hypothetical protein
MLVPENQLLNPSVSACNMSKWQDEKQKGNRQSIARLTKALPENFPSNVLSRALSRPFVPPTPRARDRFLLAGQSNSRRSLGPFAYYPQRSAPRLGLAAWQ